MAGPKKTALFLGFPRAFFARAPGRQAELFFSVKKLYKTQINIHELSVTISNYQQLLTTISNF
jgi:hypothetical protein